MKKTLIMVSVLSGTFFTFGQSEVDVYRYSNTYVQGSARFDAMGGAFGALGAESGCININPAGFGKYSATALSFGLSSTIHKTETTFRGNENNPMALSGNREDYLQTKTRVPNMSAVIVSDVSGSSKGFLYTQFFLGLNRVADFNNSFNYQGQQYESLLDVFCNQAYGIASSDLVNQVPFTSSLAYQTYAINPDNSGTNYYPDLTSGDMLHNRTVYQRGGINQWYLGLSTNYLDKLLIGASFSYNSINYYENLAHKETLIDTAGVSLRSFLYDYSVTSKGGGSNIKIGATLMPNDYFRFALAIHSPTFYEITDEYYADMTAVHKDGVRYVPNGYQGTAKYKYRLWTPTKFVGSMAFILGGNGSINIDAEYMNYGWGRLKSTKDQTYAPYSYSVENATIKAYYGGVINLRIGAEYVINNAIYLRAGYGYYPKGNQLITAYGGNSTQTMSAGVGFRFNRLYLDLAVKQLQASTVYYAFQESRADIKITNTTINAGIRYKFDY